MAYNVNLCYILLSISKKTNLGSKPSDKSTSMQPAITAMTTKVRHHWQVLNWR